MITLPQRLAEYVSFRRSLGFDLVFEERLLRVFTAFISTPTGPPMVMP